MRSRFHRAAALAMAFSVCAVVPAAAQWASLGDMPAPARSGNTVTFKNAQGVVAVTAISPEIVRVRFSPTPALGRDHSYAIVSKDFGDPHATIASAADTTTITTAALRVTIRHLSFFNDSATT